MENAFKKICYENNTFYSLHHVYGYNVGSAYSKGLHYDTTLTVAYFKKCNGSICIEGNRYTINDGDIFILNYDELHSVSIDKDNYCERITLLVKEQIVSGFPCDADKFFSIFHNRRRGYGNCICAENVKKYGFDKAFEKILEYATENTSNAKVLELCKVVELLASLEKAVCHTAEVVASPKSGNSIINDVIKYIDSTFCKDTDCEAISEKFHISKYHLSHVFKESVGISLWDYVIIRRLFRFNELVRQGSSVKEAYLSVGFNNYSNFYRLYKKHMKISPLEFKNQL